MRVKISLMIHLFFASSLLFKHKHTSSSHFFHDVLHTIHPNWLWQLVVGISLKFHYHTLARKTFNPSHVMCTHEIYKRVVRGKKSCVAAHTDTLLLWNKNLKGHIINLRHKHLVSWFNWHTHTLLVVGGSLCTISRTTYTKCVKRCLYQLSWQ